MDPIGLLLAVVVMTAVYLFDRQKAQRVAVEEELKKLKWEKEYEAKKSKSQ